MPTLMPSALLLRLWLWCVEPLALSAGDAGRDPPPRSEPEKTLRVREELGVCLWLCPADVGIEIGGVEALGRLALKRLVLSLDVGMGRGRGTGTPGRALGGCCNGRELDRGAGRTISAGDDAG